MEKNRPACQLNTSRGLLKFILLSFITFGIYPLVILSSMSSDINLIASKHDGRKTMHYCLLIFVVAPLTFGIATYVWYHNFSDRVGNELARRRIPYSFGAADYWLWGISGSLIFVGPFIYTYKSFKAMNLLCADYNVNG